MATEKKTENDVYVVYFSSATGNTKRLEKLALEAVDSLLPRDEFLYVDDPYVLITPTYGGGKFEARSRSRSLSF